MLLLSTENMKRENNNNWKQINTNKRKHLREKKVENMDNIARLTTAKNQQRVVNFHEIRSYLTQTISSSLTYL